jgi:hypothetical protein
MPGSGASWSSRASISATELSAPRSTRPEKSPCLAGLEGDSAKYGEALAIIEAGRDLLAARPRADKPGFELTSPVEIEKERRYRARLRLEAEMRAAAARGEKRYAREEELR